AVVTAFPANRQLVGLQVPQVAPQQFTLQATYASSQGWTAALLARAASGQFEDDLNRFSLDPFFQLDSYVSKRLRNIEIFGGVENLTASRVVIARTPLVNLGPPITGKVGFKVSFE